MAISADETRWFLLNVSPDVHEQLGRLPTPNGHALRRSPVTGVLVTDAELDHTLGLALLRESRALDLYATSAVQAMLERDSRILTVTQAFAKVRTTDLPLGFRVALRDMNYEPTGLIVEAFAVAGDPPRFARNAAAGHTVGFTITDERTGGRLGFVPGCGALDAGLLERLAQTDLLLFDGTFWSDDELIALGISDRRAREMDHLPISGPGGSLEQLTELPGVRTVYTHINNTNPVLLEHSPEREIVVRKGATIGQDGMAFTL